MCSIFIPIFSICIGPPIAPGSPPANFIISARGPRSLTFSCEPPILPHGVIIGYQLSCSPQRPGFPEIFNQSTHLEVTRVGFAPDTFYTCSVFASTRAGSGPSVNRTVRTLEARKIYRREVIPCMLFISYYIYTL